MPERQYVLTGRAMICIRSIDRRRLPSRRNPNNREPQRAQLRPLSTLNTERLCWSWSGAGPRTHQQPWFVGTEAQFAQADENPADTQVVVRMEAQVPCRPKTRLSRLSKTQPECARERRCCRARKGPGARSRNLCFHPGCRCSRPVESRRTVSKRQPGISDRHSHGRGLWRQS